MIDATAITDKATLAQQAAAWLMRDGRRDDARTFKARAASIPGMNGMAQLCNVYGVPVRWHL